MSLILNRSMQYASRFARRLNTIPIEHIPRVSSQTAAAVAGKGSLPDWASEVVDTSEKFAVTFDVSQFKPSELKVNVSGNDLTVMLCRDAIGKDGIQRSLLRKYVLPEEASIEGLHTSLSENGRYLTIETIKRKLEYMHSPEIPITKG